jgi:MFS family permease
MAGNRVTTQSAQLPLDAYSRDLATRLRGPHRRREQILAELRDGLDHAVSNHIANGLTEAEAVRAAISEFGTPEAVADAFAGELATAHARRTIAAYVVTGPLVGIWWLLLLHPHPWRTGAIAFLVAIPVIPLIALAIAAAVTLLATTGRLIRWLPEANPRSALTATIAIAALALIVDITVLVIYTRSSMPAQPLAALAVTASLLRIACSITTLRHVIALWHDLAGDRRSNRVGSVANR